MRPTVLTKLVVLVVTAIAFGACTGRDPKTAGSVSAGGSIVVGLSEIGSLDPARAASPSALNLLRTACDGLLGLDYKSGTPKAALAQDWLLSNRGRKLTVSLRAGMRFHDGTSVSPEAVREALSRVARPSVSSPWASLVARIEGFAEVQSGSATHLSGVRILEDQRLEINLSEPFSSMDTVLAHPALTPVSLKSLEQAPEGPELPVCSGPYRITPGNEQKDLRLGKVADARTTNQSFLNNGAGAADLILIRSFDSGEDAYAAFTAGQVDIAPVPESRVGEAQSAAGFQSEPVPQITYLGFDTAHPATGDPRVRQAISLAVDRLAMIDAAYGDKRRPATGWLPATHTQARGSSCGRFIRRISDPDRAKQLLSEAQAGLEPGGGLLELSLFYDGRTTARLVAEALQIQIEQVLDIKVSPTPVEGQDIFAHFNSRGAQGPSAGSGAAAWIMTTKVDLGLADEFLGAGSNGPLAIQDLAFSRLIEDARSATSQAEIQKRYARAEAELCQTMPGVPLWTGVSSWMFSPKRVSVQSDAYLDSLGSPLLRHSFATDD